MAFIPAFQQQADLSNFTDQFLAFVEHSVVSLRLYDELIEGDGDHWHLY